MRNFANHAMALVLALLATDACAQWQPGTDPAAGDTKRPAPDARFHLPSKASPSPHVDGEASARGKAADRRAATTGTGGETVPTSDNQDSRHEGPARFDGRPAKKRDWEVKGRAPALDYGAGDAHPGINTLAAPGNEKANNEYLFTRTDETTEVNVGHHAIGHDGLVMHDFRRRGMSATRSLPSGVSGTAFAMRAAPVTGDEHILGLEDGDSRVMGGVASINPFDDALAVTATVLSGRDRAAGTSTEGRPTSTRGDAAGVAAESRLIGDTLHLRGEYARTDHYFGGAAGNRAKRDDDAALARVEYAPVKGAGRGNASTELSLGAVYRETGPFYRSIANRQAAADKSLRRVYSDFRRGSVKMSLAAETAHDNVDNTRDRPRLSTDMSTLKVSYSPGQHPGANGQAETPWYGRPSLSSKLQYRRQEQSRLLRDHGNSGVDRRFRNARGSARFSYPAWSWHVGHDVGFRDDSTPHGADQRRDASDVGMSFSVANRIAMELQYRYDRVHEENRPVMRSRTWRASAEAELIPDTLTGSLDYGMKLADANNSAKQVEHGFVDLELDWRIVKAGKHRPGMSVWLRGHLRHLENQAEPPSKSRPSRIFVGMRMDWLDTPPRGD